jgi:predicted DsbA family dithiol-disulfide isomerase
LKVEIWSDVVCPWCSIGKRRFESALARFEHRDEVDVVWRSFELDPNAPRVREGDYADRLARKYGMTREQAVEMHQRITATAAEAGLTFRFDQARAGNTFDAHRLLHLAAKLGVQGPVKERLMRAYFSEGEAIGDPDTLARLVEEVGIPADQAWSVLEGDAFAAEVRAEEREAAELGINGVPFFVFDRRYGVSGAQPADLLLQALEQAWREAHPIRQLTPVGATGSEATCTDDTCAI